MRTFSTIKTTKRNVVRDEIETAIRLMFTGGSHIAATVLAWAAIDILRAIAETTGKQTLRAKIERSIRPEKIKFWRNLERQSYTYFKHADTDAFAERSFRPESLSFALAYAVTDYGTLFGQSTLLMRVYLAWFMSRYPDVFYAGLEGQIEYFRTVFNFDHDHSFEESIAAAADFFKNFEQHNEELIALVPDNFRDQLEV